MRSDVAHLEEQLLVRWSHETLVAYGKALRDAGDPRGELIAIDLGTGDPDAKPELEAAWLGEEAADAVTTQFGFVVDCLDLEAALPALDRIVPYARAFDLHGEPSEVLEALAILARAPRPWLGTLQLRQLDARVLPLVDDALARRLIDATPHLRKLVVHGHRVLSQFPHPALERLVADGHDAIATLLGHGVLPRVDTLDLALHPDTDIEREPPPDELRALLPASALPQMRTLDLSRNEPRELPLAPNSLGGKTPIYDVLGRLGVLPQLAQLRVPSIRTHDQREHLQAALDRMPNLRMLEIARMYVKARVALRHRTARITVPPPCAWPAADGVGDHDALLFELDGEQFRCELERAHEVVEAATLDAGQRAAWATLWSVAEDLTTRDEDKPDKLATSLLATVLDTFPDDEHTAWDDLRERLDETSARKVTVRRIAGWATAAVADDDEDDADDTELPPAPRVHATSPRITELELALQATWDRDRLAVYADELQQLGDPRGELIAIDLHRAREPRPDLADRRDELHALVFGSSPHVTSELGFAAIELHEWSDDDTLAQLLAGAAGPYLGAVDLGGLDARIVRNLKLLAAAPRPWLRRIAVTTTDEIDEALDGAGLVAMWPHLAELDLVAATRTRLFRALQHPNIRTLRVTGWQALEGTAWPAVERLDLAYGASVVPPPALSLGDAAALPALRELDLSRNEPSTPDVSLDRDDRFQGGELEVFPLLADYDAALLARVALLRLPSLRTLAHVRAVQDVLDRMPALERVEIARVYPGTPPIVLRHPRAELAIPAPCPWPALDTVAENAMLAIEQVYISIPAALAAMERHYARMPLAAREAWDDFWDLYRNTRREFVISAAALHRAAAALEELDRHRHAFADELVDVLRGPAIADQRVTATHVVY